MKKISLLTLSMALLGTHLTIQANPVNAIYKQDGSVYMVIHPHRESTTQLDLSGYRSISANIKCISTLKKNEGYIDITVNDVSGYQLFPGQTLRIRAAGIKVSEQDAPKYSYIFVAKWNGPDLRPYVGLACDVIGHI